MELNLSETIIRLRKTKGLTQEQLANLLGVSAPAVSKWETGASYPDITLLCPLARALDTDVDTLLQFEESLSDEEVNAYINTALAVCRTQGSEAGEAEMMALLRRYPNSIPLQFNAAMAYTAFLLLHPTVDEATRQRWDAQKKELFTRVHSHRDSPYWQAAAVELAGMALAAGETDAAQILLEELPERVVDPTNLWVLLYEKQGNPERALATLQKRLYALVHQVQLCLTSMSRPALMQDTRRALEICKVYTLMDETFGLGGLHEGLMLDLLVDMGDVEAAAACFARYVDGMTAETAIPNPVIFAPTYPGAARPVMSVELRRMLLLGLKEKKYEAVLAHPVGKAALERLQASVG